MWVSVYLWLQLTATDVCVLVCVCVSVFPCVRLYLCYRRVHASVDTSFHCRMSGAKFTAIVCKFKFDLTYYNFEDAHYLF